jgi:hypothetical protein
VCIVSKFLKTPKYSFAKGFTIAPKMWFALNVLPEKKSSGCARCFTIVGGGPQVGHATSQEGFMG